MAEDLNATAGELDAVGSILTDDLDKSDTSDDKPKDAEDASAAGEPKKDDTIASKDAADDKDKDGDADKSKDSAPETYDTFTVPEGVTIDDKVLEKFAPMLKGLNATQEQAQAFIDLKVEMDLVAAKAQEQAWADTQKTWKETAETDSEYGGVNYDANVQIARAAVQKLGGDALVTALTETGMGNHPEFIRAFVRIGKAISEDTVSFGSTVQGEKSLAERLHPKHNVG